MEYLIKPNNGEREDTRLSIDFTEDEIKALLAAGYVKVNEDDFSLLIGNGDKEYCISDDGTLYERPPYVPPIDEVKANKKSELKTKRDELEIAAIEVGGHTYDYDERSRERINIAITMLSVAPDGTTISWAMADNTTADVTIADLTGVIIAVGLRSEELHARYRAAKEAVDACETAEDVEKVEF